MKIHLGAFVTLLLTVPLFGAVAADPEIELRLSADRQAALPGELVTYTIHYRNGSPHAVEQVVINGSTPPYTHFVDASCASGDRPQQPGCSIVAQPAPGGVGSVQWRLDGKLSPAFSGSVSYQVRIND